MENQFQFFAVKGQSTMSNGLGISPERTGELQKQLCDLIDEHADMKRSAGFDVPHVLALFSQYAQSPQEVAWMGYTLSGLVMRFVAARQSAEIAAVDLAMTDLKTQEHVS